HQDRPDHYDQPGTLGELHHREDQDDDGGEDPGREVDDQLAAPPPLLAAPMVFRHPEPGHREPGEHADGVERHQAVDVGADRDDQRQRYHGQQDDAVGEHQPVPALHQPARQERVLSHEAG